MRRVLVAMSVVVPCLLMTASCADRNPVGPTSSATLDQFVHALRQQGLNVSLGGQISSNANGFFSVPAQQLRVSDGQVNAFILRAYWEKTAGALNYRGSQCGIQSSQVNHRNTMTMVATSRIVAKSQWVPSSFDCSWLSPLSGMLLLPLAPRWFYLNSDVPNFESLG